MGGLCGLLALPQPPAQAQEAVDVELVLAVDVSLSMSAGELEIQRRGYAAALTHKEVIDAILDGAHGKIAITYFEWAGSLSQHVIVPWTVIASAEDAMLVAERLSARPPNSARRTSISGALQFAGDLFAESGFRGMRRVVDISGDGPNNQGVPVVAARDALTSAGITVNGLPLMTNGGLTSSFDVDDLDRYYRECVIGGPGAFMIPVNDWTQFPEAIRRKLVLELAWKSDESPPLLLAQAEGGYDCMIGEKMWRDRSWMWTDP
ncbi:DUF1194 domain-containing protein [Nitratireductor pacificus]|uniref:VWFA domain-containing protein n=1 Tax=Nitratireductor pacificus pht-3B TaxID=391937 RepID=K2MFK4_9HYPH|nr:DUF1194 domain-containing protein [Nitratireductor pacificus]EKF20931.1 hypothetical protein NA2_01095 [Nitratireductor pacificus pht-3B]